MDFSSSAARDAVCMRACGVLGVYRLGRVIYRYRVMLHCLVWFVGDAVCCFGSGEDRTAAPRAVLVVDYVGSVEVGEARGGEVKMIGREDEGLCGGRKGKERHGSR